eukprot:5401259-Amphidinium_carterae.2
MRSDQWVRIRRDQEDKLSLGVMAEPFEAGRPWESVIRRSVRFGMRVRFAAQTTTSLTAAPAGGSTTQRVAVPIRPKPKSKTIAKERRGDGRHTK